VYDSLATFRTSWVEIRQSRVLWVGFFFCFLMLLTYYLGFHLVLHLSAEVLLGLPSLVFFLFLFFYFTFLTQPSSGVFIVWGDVYQPDLCFHCSFLCSRLSSGNVEVSRRAHLWRNCLDCLVRRGRLVHLMGNSEQG